MTVESWGSDGQSKCYIHVTSVAIASDTIYINCEIKSPSLEVFGSFDNCFQ